MIEGLSLKYLIKAMGVHRDYSLREEVNKANEKITSFMVRQIERWQRSPDLVAKVPKDALENIKREVCYRRRLDGKRLSEGGSQIGQITEDKLELRLIRAAYRKLLKMRDREEICDATVRAITRDLDLQTVRVNGKSDLAFGGV